MSSKGSILVGVQVAETLDLGSGAATDPVVSHGISGGPYSYGPSTTIVPTKVWSGTVTLTAGALTLDMTALTRSPLATVDLTGLEILAIHIKAASTNTQLVTIVPGASNGYTALGLGLSLLASNEAVIHMPTGVAIDSTHKTLDLASAYATASADIVIWANTP